MQGTDALVANLSSDPAFCRAVQAQDTKAAARAAVQVVKAFFPKSSATPGVSNASGDGDEIRTRGRPVRKSSTSKDGGPVGDRMVVRASQKRSAIADLAGVEVVVVSVEGGGVFQCRRTDNGKTVRIPKKSLALLSSSFPTSSVGGGSDTPRKQGGQSRKRSADYLSPFASNEVENGPDGDSEVQKILSKISKQMLDLEEFIPWNAVTKAWKSRRPNWRRTVRNSDNVIELASRLKDLLVSLVWEKSWKLAHGGKAMENEVEEICKGQGDHNKFLSLWENISREVRRWVQDRDHTPQPFAVQMPPHKTARIALAAMDEASRHGEEGIEQVPLEAITNFDMEGLEHLKSLLLESKIKLCDMIEKLKDPCMSGSEKQHLMSVCEKHLLSFSGPGAGALECMIHGDAVSMAAQGEETDVSECDC